MAEEQVDVEYISLHGYIRNTPSDTRAYGTPAESRQEYLTSGKEYIEARKTQRDEGTKGKKQECQQDWTCPQQVRELKQESDPHIRATV